MYTNIGHLQALLSKDFIHYEKNQMNDLDIFCNNNEAALEFCQFNIKKLGLLRVFINVKIDLYQDKSSYWRQRCAGLACSQIPRHAMLDTAS